MRPESTINLREIPFVRFLLPLVVGIVLSFWFIFPAYYFIGLGSLCFAAMLILALLKVGFTYRWLFGTFVFGGLMSLGYLLSIQHNDLNQSNHFRHFLQNKNTLIAKVTASPKVGKRLKTQLSILAVRDSMGQMKTATGNLLAYLEANTSASKLAYGDVLLLRGWIQPTPPPMNPHQFNYQQYLRYQNIHYQSFIKKEDWQNTGANQGNSLFKFAQKTRIVCINQLREYLPTEREFSVGAALILGYKDEIAQDVRDAYSQTGAMHVLAVSGLHVGLIYLFLNFFLGFVKTENRIFNIARPILLVAGIWAFALLTGMSPSVMRAATMFSFLIVGLSMKRYINVYNSLASSAFFLLCFNPYLIANVGFQLSYVAVLGIVYFQPRIYSLWQPGNAWVDNFWALTAVSIAAQMTTLPFSLYYFHQFPLFFWLASLIVIPAATFILGLGITSLIFSKIPFVGWLAGKLLFGLIWCVNFLIFGIQKIPFSLIEGIWISGLAVALLYLVLLLFAWFLKTQKLTWLTATLGVLLLVMGERAQSLTQDASQREITVYHSYKNAITDFISNRKTTTVSGIGVQSRQVGFAAANHQSASGIHLNDKAYFRGNYETSDLFIQQNFIQFYDKKILIIDDEKLLNHSFSMEIDYAFIQNSPYLQIAKVKDTFNPKMIIFDATNNRKAIKIWKQQCKEIGMPCHDVNESGAWTVRF